MAWPKGKSRKPQPEQKLETDAELIDPADLLDADASKGRRKPSTSKPEPKAAKAKADAPKWTIKERIAQAAEEADWRDRSDEVSTHIDREVLEDIRNEYGCVLQWWTESVLGQEFPERMNQAQLNGWLPLQPGDLGIEKVRLPGLILCARSVLLDKKAREHQRRQAEEPIRKVQQGLIEGVPGVRGSDHPSATRGYNHIRKSVERLDIPRDD